MNSYRKKNICKSKRTNHVNRIFKNYTKRPKKSTETDEETDGELEWDQNRVKSGHVPWKLHNVDECIRWKDKQWSYLSWSFLKSDFLSIFDQNIYLGIVLRLLHSSILTTWSAHLNILDLINLTILVESCKLWSSIMRNFHKS